MLIVMRIPAEHVDVAFAVASLFMVEERNFYSSLSAELWGYAEVRVTKRGLLYQLLWSPSGTIGKPPAPARP